MPGILSRVRPAWAFHLLILLLFGGCAQAQAPFASGIRQTVLVRGLEHPWGMAWLPDGSLLISERPGRLRLVRDGVLDPEPIAGVPGVLAAV